MIYSNGFMFCLGSELLYEQLFCFQILTISNYIKWKQDLELSYLALHDNKYMSNAESMPQHKELLA